MKYGDFQVEIGPRQGVGSYPVRMRAPDGGSETGIFENPFAEEPSSWRKEYPSEALERLGKEVGEALFDSLFSTPALRALYERSFGQLEPRPEDREDDEERGLRLRLTLLADDRLDFDELDSLPWELLRRAQTIGHLSDRRITPVVRSPMMPTGVHRPRLPATLRVLVVGASPEGHPPLDLQAEMEAIRDALGGHGRVEAEYLGGLEKPEVRVPGKDRRATLRRVRERLLRARQAGSPFQALHFMGHGYLDGGSGQGGVLLEDLGGKADFVDGEILAQHLQDLRLRLVVLNSCYGADAGGDAFGGVARSLLLTGIPAVIAVRREIADRAAGTFGGALYRALAVGDPVDTALAEARLAIREALREGGLDRDLPPDWARPRLYLGGLDGELFRLDTRRVEVSLADPRGAQRQRALREAVAEFVDMPAASLKLEAAGKTGHRLVVELPGSLAEELVSAHRRRDPGLVKQLEPIAVEAIEVPRRFPPSEWLPLLALPLAVAFLDALVLKQPQWMLQSSRAIGIHLPGEPLAALVYYLGVGALCAAAILLPRLARPSWRVGPALRLTFLGLVLGLALLQRPIPKVDNLQHLRGWVDPRWGFSSYLFIRPVPSTDCWLQLPSPLATHRRRRWASMSIFDGVPGQQFEVMAVASRNPLLPEVASRPGAHPCSTIPGDAALTVYLVELR